MNVRNGPSHPLCLAAIAVLAWNDHVFKGLGPSFLTGKLSDLAWLVVAPVVLAAVLTRAGASDRQAGRVALATTALAFVALQLWPPLGDAWCALVGGAHVADAADLWCLPALFLAPRCWRPTRPVALALPVGALVLCATSFAPYVDYARAPCRDAFDWDPQAPLEVPWRQGDGVDGLPDTRTRNFTDAVWVRGPRGDVEILVLPMRDDLGMVICPLGGLEPDTRYRWKVGRFYNPHPHQLYAWDPAEPGVRSFRTGPARGTPTLTRERCEALAAQGPTHPWTECHPEDTASPEDTGSTCDTANTTGTGAPCGTGSTGDTGTTSDTGTTGDTGT